MDQKYSFDISYKLVNDQTQNPNVRAALDYIIKDYPSISWYASDCGPSGTSVQKPIHVNIGYLTNSIGDIVSVADRIKNHPDLFVDHVSKDTKRIYRSPDECARMNQNQRDEYNETVSALVGDEKALYNLCYTG